jgi:Kef-type K+ transport system membrane component KefB
VHYVDAAIPAIALGAIAAVSAPAGLEVVARTLGRRGTVVRHLQVTTAIDALVGVTAVGLLMCIHHAPSTTVTRQVTATEWAVITIAIGVVGGALFHLFLGNESHPDRFFISLAGAVVLASGAAAYLHLSPLLTSMVVGAMLVNTSRNRDQIAATLSNAERPFYFALLVFAGATWAPSARAWWAIPVILFFVARVLAKIGGGRLGAQLLGALPVLGPQWGRALLGQGGLALALALSYHQLAGMPLRQVVFSAAIVSILLTDFLSAHMVASVVAGGGRREAGGERRGEATGAGGAEPAGSGKREANGESREEAVAREEG